MTFRHHLYQVLYTFIWWQLLCLNGVLMDHWLDHVRV